MWKELPNTPPYSTEELISSLRQLANDLENYSKLGARAVRPETTISEWAVARRAVPVLIGRMSGHPTIGDGRIGFTTELVFWSLEHRLARSQNRWYRLGELASEMAHAHQ